MQGWKSPGIFWYIFKKPATSYKVKKAYFIADKLYTEDEAGVISLITTFDYKITKLVAYNGIINVADFDNATMIGTAQEEKVPIVFNPSQEYIKLSFLVYVNTMKVYNGTE